MNHPFQATVGVCPKCRRCNFKRQPGIHLFGMGEFKCEDCGAVFSEPHIDDIVTSSNKQYVESHKEADVRYKNRKKPFRLSKITRGKSGKMRIF